MAYELPPLPYDYSALEPFIDTETMKLHHDKHHQAYITNVNAALANHPDLAALSVDDLLRDLNRVPEDIRTTVRNNGGGHSNHSAFWKLMGAPKTPGVGGEPTGAIANQIATDFGDFESFKKTFNETTAKQFGSGWGWLVFTGGKLKVITTANQDSPLVAGPLRHPGQRCVGARLLPEVPEPPPRVPGRVVERGELGRSEPPLRRRQGLKSSSQLSVEKSVPHPFATLLAKGWGTALDIPSHRTSQRASTHP